MSGGVRLGRIKKELERLKRDPPHGVSCWPKDGRIDCLEAKLRGAKDTPYEGGIFKLEIRVPERYPFEPPQVQFVTKIYHPNIDSSGRICLDVLKSPPQGSWKPSQNISTILTSLQLLLSEPNPDDGLMAEISQEYKHNRPAFMRKAKEWVELYAKNDHTSVADDTSKSNTTVSSGSNGATLPRESDHGLHDIASQGESNSKVAANLPRGTKSEEDSKSVSDIAVDDAVLELKPSAKQEASGRSAAESCGNAGRKGLSRKRKGIASHAPCDVVAKKSRSTQ